MEAVYIFWTCGSIDEARRISRYLVQEKWVACANIIPWVESIFHFDEKLQTQQETKVIFKTLAIHYEKIREIIKNDGSYEVPEITQVCCSRMDVEYDKWLRFCVRGAES